MIYPLPTIVFSFILLLYDSRCVGDGLILYLVFGVQNFKLKPTLVNIRVYLKIPIEFLISIQSSCNLSYCNFSIGGLVSFWKQSRKRLILCIWRNNFLICDFSCLCIWRNNFLICDFSYPCIWRTVFWIVISSFGLKSVMWSVEFPKFRYPPK